MVKITHSKGISSFGGLNLIHQELDGLGAGRLLNRGLPALPPQSRYNWKDIFYSMLSIYLSGGDCIEDIKTVLRSRFGHSPLFRLCSPDTVLKRLKELAAKDCTCRTPRGTVDHQYNFNETLADLNIRLLKSTGAFADGEATVLDYDNTITFTEKADSKMTYKRDYGYQPGVCFLNGDRVLYIENRNGNSDAKSFQADTLTRMFDRLAHHGVDRVGKFRADAASYQFEVVKLLSEKAGHFYIGARNSYVESQFSRITDWEETADTLGDPVWVGEVAFTPFKKHYRDPEKAPVCRLLVKKKKRADAQCSVFTGDAYDYWAVLTNDFESSVKGALGFYYQRGAVERQFDILKNDNGWKNLPFSKLSQNTVFFYFTAMVKNLYVNILGILSSKYRHIRTNMRVKRLLFLFVAIPGKWVKRSRQWCLRLYGQLPLRL